MYCTTNQGTMSKESVKYVRIKITTQSTRNGQSLSGNEQRREGVTIERMVERTSSLANTKHSWPFSRLFANIQLLCWGAFKETYSIFEAKLTWPEERRTWVKAAQSHIKRAQSCTSLSVHSSDRQDDCVALLSRIPCRLPSCFSIDIRNRLQSWSWDIRFIQSL